MTRTLTTTVLALFLVALMPLAALGQTEEPYSSSTVPATTIPASVTATGSGLTATFTVAGTTGDCTWDFGDNTTGTGNPVVHTYAAAGNYTATATCGAEVLGIVFVADGAVLAQTGFDALAMAAVAGFVLLAGLGIVARTRRSGN